MSREIRVVVVDDHGVVREGIRRVLESEPGFVVVGEGADGSEAIDLVERERPDVLVVDVAMPGVNGMTVAAELSRRNLPTRILILSMYNEPQYVLECMKAGARGYLLKDSPPAALRRAVREIADGGTCFPEGIASRPSPATPPMPRRSPLESLTPRELEVLVGIARGETNKGIAAQLGISHRTVETHREALMDKLDIRTVAGLTRLALEEGVL